MSRLRIVFSRLRGIGRARRLDRELGDEIAAHLEEAADEYRRQGLSPEDARRAALRHFGGVAQIEDAYREQRSLQWLDHVGRDLRHAVRALGRSPGFFVVVLLVLAMAAGATTSVFALLDSIVFRPLPYPHSDRLVVVEHAAPGLNRDEVGLSTGLYFHYLDHAQSLESIGLYQSTIHNLRVAGFGTERVHLTYTTSSLFHVLGVNPALGRLFTEEDGAPGFMSLTWAVPILLSHDFWVSHFGADSGVIGRLVPDGNGDPRRVVGVMPEGFAFPDAQTQVWMLLEPMRRAANFARSLGEQAVARLRRGATAASAQAELTEILPGIEGVYRDATPQRMAEVRLSPVVLPLKAAVVGDVAHVLWTLFGGMALLLVIACANAAGLFVVRAEHRRREVAVRVALGARRFEIVRLFVVEALVLTGLAAILGVLLAQGLLSAVVTVAPIALPRASEIRLGAGGLVFAAAVSLLTAIFYGALSTRGWKGSSAGNLLSTETWATGRQAGRRFDPLLIIQVAVAASLMVGAALMVRTYVNLSHSQLGFMPDRVLTMEVTLPGRQAPQGARILDGLLEQVRRLPGVEAASAASFLPLTPSEDMFPVQAGGAPVPFKFFMPGYLQVMKTPIVEGAGFALGERVATPYPVVVSAALARRLYPGEGAIGKSIRRLNKDWSVVEMWSRTDNHTHPVPAFTIAGVVGDVRELTLRRGPSETVYVPMIDPGVEQSIVPTDLSLVVRTRVPPATLAAAVRQAIVAGDPDLSVGRIRTMDAVVAAARAPETFVGLLLLVAAAASLFLGVVGVYGSVAQVVRRRTREIGIRMALGARRVEVVQMVVTGSLRAVVAGAVIGLATALAGGRALGSLLFGVGPRDPRVLLSVSGVLLAAATAAAVLAAWRATRIGPLLAMRE